jgi:hypothetical protein
LLGGSCFDLAGKLAQDELLEFDFVAGVVDVDPD